MGLRWLTVTRFYLLSSEELRDIMVTLCFKVISYEFISQISFLT